MRFVVHIDAHENSTHPVMVSCWDCHWRVIKYFQTLNVPLEINL